MRRNHHHLRISYPGAMLQVQRVVADGGVINEGDVQEPIQPFAIPYRSLLPKKEDCENLLVPVCLSASHIAFGSARMEPVYLILGQACGVPASLAIDANASLQTVRIESIHRKLSETGVVLRPLPSQ